jgi:hypothetical protein
MNYTSVTNPIWSNQEHTIIDCMVVFTELGTTPVPFTASQNTVYPYETEIFNDCAAGRYGPVAAYVPPPPAPEPTASQNKQQAVDRLAATDWVNEPDVYDPANNPHLTNRSDFITYRSAVRQIAVYPVAGYLTWPTEPVAAWSS